MEEALLDILAALRQQETLSPAQIEAIMRLHNRDKRSGQPRAAKKHMLPLYRSVKETDPERWKSWNVTPELERRLESTLRMKPRRTASGVATITVITKPQPCSSNCLYCPNDLRMPKSYLSEEPACQRAERCWFDPYLQVSARLRTLEEMGHVTDKIELIVLGGTWTDYPSSYQVWFMRELFRALNEAADPALAGASRNERTRLYERLQLPRGKDELAAQALPFQRRIDAGEMSYNQAFELLYGQSPAWRALSSTQVAALPELFEQHLVNETAAHRVVGLVVETRPDAITPAALRLLRQLGCTKIQMGIQTLNPALMRANRRACTLEAIERAFSLTRLFGFKTHAHFMVNLLGATPESDRCDYERFATDPRFSPDEVKLYPTALIAGTGLVARYENGSWQPYDDQTLRDVLAFDTRVTPPYTRISRMIRDFSAGDIVAGNKKCNLRQMVEGELEAQGCPIQEIRHREVSVGQIDVNSLRMEEIAYSTATTQEVFLQWVTGDNRIAGFLRLSFPDARAMAALGSQAPVEAGSAMIREVHVYGAVSGLGTQGEAAQHRGLGRALVARACELARQAGCGRIHVISAVGTRNYYRHLGFYDEELYLARDL